LRIAIIEVSRFAECCVHIKDITKQSHGVDSIRNLPQIHGELSIMEEKDITINGFKLHEADWLEEGTPMVNLHHRSCLTFLLSTNTFDYIHASNYVNFSFQSRYASNHVKSAPTIPTPRPI
jgi:hypothetical protein